LCSQKTQKTFTEKQPQRRRRPSSTTTVNHNRPGSNNNNIIINIKHLHHHHNNSNHNKNNNKKDKSQRNLDTIQSGLAREDTLVLNSCRNSVARKTLQVQDQKTTTATGQQQQQPQKQLQQQQQPKKLRSGPPRQWAPLLSIFWRRPSLQHKPVVVFPATGTLLFGCGIVLRAHYH
jgi:hypothetical protein